LNYTRIREFSRTLFYHSCKENAK